MTTITMTMTTSISMPKRSQKRQHPPGWCGVRHATDEDHAQAFDRYDGHKTSYRWSIEELNGIDIPHICHIAEAADGIWTLAELESSLRDGCMPEKAIRRRVATCAQKMEMIAKGHQ